MNLPLFDKIQSRIAISKRMGMDTVKQNRDGASRKVADPRLAQIAAKLRKIRERMNLTREQFCEPLNENSEYWGMIERGVQPISLGKLLQVCEVYHIPIEDVVKLDYQKQDCQHLREEITALLDDCDSRQLEVIRKFITDIASTL